MLVIDKIKHNPGDITNLFLVKKLLVATATLDWVQLFSSYVPCGNVLVTLRPPACMCPAGEMLHCGSTESREQRAESREQRAESRDLIPKTRSKVGPVRGWIRPWP